MNEGNSDPSPRIVVIGGGIAGLMCAFRLRTQMRGSDITVLEQGRSIPYAYGSSSRSAACSRQQFGCEHNVRMSMYSTSFYERFQELVGWEDAMFWQRGYLFLYRDRAKWIEAQARVTNGQSWGLTEARALSGDEVVSEFPFVGKDGLLGGTFCPTDGFLDAGGILTALKMKLVDMGVKVITNTKVTGFKVCSCGVRSVITESGSFSPDFLVNCTGAYASRIGRLLGTTLNVAPEIRFLWSAKFQRQTDDFGEAEFGRFPFTILTANDQTPYIKPEPGKGQSSFLVGCEHETEPEWDFDPEDMDRVPDRFHPNRPGYHEGVWQDLVDWLPFTELLGFRNKVMSGYYETTPSHNPVIGFDPNHRNVVHCCGFSGHGLMHGPAAGQIVADLLQYGDYRTFPTAERSLSYAAHAEGTGELETCKI
jgi:sarcosine oxidase, subunit beta